MKKYNNIIQIYSNSIFDIVKDKKIENWRYILTVSIKLFFFIKKIDLLFIYNKFIKFSQLKFDFFFLNFFKLLIINNKLFILSKIFKEFLFLECINKKNILVIKIFSSFKFKKKTKLNLKKILEKRLLFNIKLNYLIDKSLISGIKIYANNIIIDITINNFFLNFSNYLKY